ncbi:MAG: ribonuclease P protein component [Ferruginibacter sp.]
MEQKIKYTLGKAEKLKSRKAIDQLFAGGKSFSVFPLKVIYKLNSKESSGSKTSNIRPQTLNLLAAFSASKRNFKKATERNRVKRLMREAYRLHKNELQDCLREKQLGMAVFILYTGNELPEYNLIQQKTVVMLKKLLKIVHEEIVIHN